MDECAHPALCSVRHADARGPSCRAPDGSAASPPAPCQEWRAPSWRSHLAGAHVSAPCASCRQGCPAPACCCEGTSQPRVPPLASYGQVRYPRLEPLMQPCGASFPCCARRLSYARSSEQRAVMHSSRSGQMPGCASCVPSISRLSTRAGAPHQQNPPLGATGEAQLVRQVRRGLSGSLGQVGIAGQPALCRAGARPRTCSGCLRLRKYCIAQMLGCSAAGAQAPEPCLIRGAAWQRSPAI